MKNEDIIVKKSKIHGTGIFAGRNFKEGEVVLRWKPKYRPISEQKSLTKEELHYSYIVGEQIVIMQEPERFMNHACDNNTHVVDSCDVALRDIKAGEEITANYNNDGMVEFKCECGSGHCRRTVK